jgi:uncharacterized protein with GYD domain
MVRYLSLINYTPAAAQAVKDSPGREATFCKQVEAAGGRVESAFWATGRVDGAIVFTAPDDATATNLLLSLRSCGFVHPRSVRVFV